METAPPERLKPRESLGGIALPDLRATPGHLIRRAEQAHTALWFAEIDTGLTLLQYAVVLVLVRRPRIDQRTLGEQVSLDKSTAANVLTRLTRAGLVERIRNPSDGRRNLLLVTPSGQEAFAGITPTVLRVQQRLLSPLRAAEAERFVELSARVARCADPAAAAGTPGPVPDLNRLPGNIIRRAIQVKTATWLAQVGPEVTSPQYVTMLETARSPGIDQQALGAKVSLDKATVADVVARLERRELLQRVRDPWDRRRSVLDLTTKGEQALLQVLPSEHLVTDHLLKPLAAADRPDWIELCHRVVFRLGLRTA
jgi:DNA-binding MarR family transcriptional regulator